MKEPRRVPSSADDGIKSNLFFPGTCASEKTLLSLQVWHLALGTNDARGGPHLFEKMLAFLREPVDVVDRLSRTCTHVREEMQAAARLICPERPNSTLAA